MDKLNFANGLTTRGHAPLILTGKWSPFVKLSLLIFEVIRFHFAASAQATLADAAIEMAKQFRTLSDTASTNTVILATVSSERTNAHMVAGRVTSASTDLVKGIQLYAINLALNKGPCIKYLHADSIFPDVRRLLLFASQLARRDVHM